MKKKYFLIALVGLFAASVYGQRQNATYLIYPLTSLGFVFGMLSGVFIFHETVGYLQWIGVVMVMLGCYFIAKA